MAWTDATIETERLVLRAFAEPDRPTVVTLLTDPDVRRYLGGPAELGPDFDSRPLGQQRGMATRRRRAGRPSPGTGTTTRRSISSWR